MILPHVTVVGGGLAGSEAAWQAARLGADVHLYEMRPANSTPAHHTDLFAELVCSNSLGSNLISSAGGLLKDEMRQLDSLIISVADACAVPAGGALAVDRDQFSAEVTKRITEHPNIQVVREEASAIPEGITVVATGPLTSDAMASFIKSCTGSEQLFFYDAAAPIVTAESVDESLGFWAARWDKGGKDYFNCPLEKDEYIAFYQALLAAEKHEGHLEEELRFFEGCMPIEEIARRGLDTMRFGPMRPVGLKNKDGRRPYAVVQLRRENAAGSLLNLVGFQTSLRFGEQKRVFSLIPALHEAEFVRYGVMHRNTFLNAPTILLPTYQWKQAEHTFFAGQITGVEGYVESAGAGLVAGMNAGRMAMGSKPVALPTDTLLGALAGFITSANPEDFQPMNANFGLLPPYEGIKDKKERKRLMGERALESLRKWRLEVGL